MAAKKRLPARTTIRGKGWKQSTTVASDKFDVIRGAVLSSLTATPVRFTELTTRVAEHLPDFEGSIPWYTITCLRELEVRGEVLRHAAPVLYSRPAKKTRATRKSKATGARSAK